MKTTTCIVLIALLASCNARYSPELEAVLQQAGRNRPELEKTLRRYSSDLSDSLKRRAAEYLILNIELAFKVWESRPWHKDVPFVVFCEEILPYRIDTEPLEDWRKKALSSFADLDAEFSKPTVTTVEAAAAVNRVLPRFMIDRDFPAMSFSQLMATRRGTCEQMAAFAALSMRALGVPVSVEMTPKWVSRPAGHTWNAVYDSSNGGHIRFMGTESQPGAGNQSFGWTKSKVYRKTFANLPEVGAGSFRYPNSSERYTNLFDVSAEYSDCRDTVNLNLLYRPTEEINNVYLALLYEREWHPVAQTAITDGSTAQFASIGRNIIYIPLYYTSTGRQHAADPFHLDRDGNITVFKSNSELKPIELTEITQDSQHAKLWGERSIGGIFEGANKEDFSDARLLHKITTMPKTLYQTVTLPTPVSCRYVRYVSPADGYCNIAEIEITDSQSKKLSGKVRCPFKVWNNDPTLIADKAFDGDVTTFFHAAQADKAWIGIDLGETCEVSSIRYAPRNECNRIYEEHEYQLFVMTDKGWQQSERQKAGSAGTLTFTAPESAMMYLRNITLNKDGNVFSINNNEQIWR